MALTNSGWPTNIPVSSDPLNTTDDQLRRLRLDLLERFNDIVDDWTTDPVVLSDIDVGIVIGTPDLAVVYTGAAFAIPTGATTVIDFIQETLDTGSFHNNSVNPSRLTVATAAYYRITASLQITSSSGAAIAAMNLTKNGAAIASTNLYFDGTVLTNTMFVTYIDLAAADDYYEVNVVQSSGDAWATLTAAPQAYFMIERLVGTV